ncbi:MAG: CvpA family protein [Oscillospiraceae bacterium]|nr:CvpA family protein [Oscillospiraceae bacterium]
MAGLYWMIPDIAALMLLAGMVNACARRGLLDILARFFVSIIGSIAAWVFSAPIANFLYTYIVRDALRAAVTRQVEGQIEEGVITAANWMSGLPNWLGRLIVPGYSPNVGVVDLDAAIGTLIDATVAQPALLLLRVFAFMFVFFVIRIVGGQLVWVFSGIGRWPLISPVNTLLGGVMGVVWAGLLLYLIAILAWAYILLTLGGNALINTQTLGGGYLFSFFFRLAG